MREGGAEEAAPQSVPASRLERSVERLAAGLALLGGAVLVTISVVVATGVAGRWLFGREITGAFEIVQVGVALAAFLFLPISQFRNGNVVVDSLTARAPIRWRAGLDAVWACCYAVIALLLAWRLGLGATETMASGTVTSMLQLPFGWAMIAGAAALVFLGLVSLLVARRHLRTPR